MIGLLRSVVFHSCCHTGPVLRTYTVTWARTQEQGSEHLPSYENDFRTEGIFFCLLFCPFSFNSGSNETMLRIFATSERIKDQKATRDPLFQERHKLVSYFKSAFPDLIAQLVPAFNATLMLEKWPLNNLEDFKRTFVHTCWDFLETATTQRIHSHSRSFPGNSMKNGTSFSVTDKRAARSDVDVESHWLSPLHLVQPGLICHPAQKH